MLNMTHLGAMKLLFLLLAAATLAAAQPAIGFIEVFGNRRMPAERLLRALDLAPGKPLPRNREDAEATLEAFDVVARAHIEAFCCDDGKTVLYIGIQERGQPALDLRPIPAGDLLLPPELVSAYEDFTQALGRATPEDLAEDLRSGHSLMRGITLRTLQDRFLALAELHTPLLRDVLAKSADEDHRAIAAYLLGYTKDKAAVAEDLQQALRDPAAIVRANAARALKAFAVLAALQPESRILIRTTWFVEMLNAPALSDRLEGARALLTLFDSLSDQTRAHLRDRALPSLFEMARFRHLPHALPAFLILGKTAGLSDAQIEAAWVAGDREKILDEAAKRLRRK